ncbi:MAG TPA: hypothetical protein VJA46_12040, partial [Acidimicrobiia bacterium]|nr:hypothetical protein [Acidimicrobiia bacterium]
CDGFAFVRLTADPLSTLASQIAAGLALLALIGLVTIAMRRTHLAEVVETERYVMAPAQAPPGEPTQDEGVADTGEAEPGADSDQTPLGGAKPDDDYIDPGEPDDEQFPPTT